MATIKAVKKKTNSKSGLKKSIDYIENPEKTLEGKLIDGYNCTPENAYEEFIIVKELRENDKGVMAHHFTQNFDPKDNITPEKALELGRELAEKNFEGHQVIIATHIDKEHIHNHLIVNSVNYQTGLKLVNNNKLLEQLKSYSDLQCEREGLNIVDRSKKSKEYDYGIYDKNKYEVITRAIKGERKSYVLATALTVDKVLSKATSKEEFINEMKKEGYSMKWSDTRKYITYIDSEGHRVRSTNLAKTFKEEKFKKENMDKEFEANRERLKIAEMKKEEELKKEEERKKKERDKKKDKEPRRKINVSKQEISNEINHLEDKKTTLSKFKNYLASAKTKAENTIRNNSDNENYIEMYKKNIEELKADRENLGVFKFKEKKIIDEKINKANDEINRIEKNLLSPGEIEKNKLIIDKTKESISKVDKDIENTELRKNDYIGLYKEKLVQEELSKLKFDTIIQEEKLNESQKEFGAEVFLLNDKKHELMLLEKDKEIFSKSNDVKNIDEIKNIEKKIQNIKNVYGDKELIQKKLDNMIKYRQLEKESINKVKEKIGEPKGSIRDKLGLKSNTKEIKLTSQDIKNMPYINAKDRALLIQHLQNREKGKIKTNEVRER